MSCTLIAGLGGALLAYCSTEGHSAGHTCGVRRGAPPTTFQRLSIGKRGPHENLQPLTSVLVRTLRVQVTELKLKQVSIL